MTEDNFPMKIRFGEEPTTKYFNSENNIKVTMTAHPEGDFRRRCFNQIKSTWSDSPQDYFAQDNDEVEQTFIDLLKGKVLPNSMEMLQFTFLIEGITLVEITHLLRHRTFSAVHAQCSADRFLNHDSVFIPSSIENSEFKNEYKELTAKCKRLYSKMVDSKTISLLDARYILNRNHRYFYYFTMNLKDAIAFIKQRCCEQVQPECDNIIAHQIYDKISEIIPELKEVINLKCDARCFYCSAKDEDNSRIYAPNKNHSQFVRKDMKTLYDKTRKEMGVYFNPQDE